MLNMKKVVKEKLADFLRHSVLRVAEVTLAGSAAAFLCTWLVHSFAMSQVKVLPSLIAAVFSALQLCPAQVVSMPCLIMSTSSLWKSLRTENMSQGTALQLLMLIPQLYIVLYAQSDLNCQIYSSLSHSSSTTGSSSPYWLSLFVAGGLLTFGLHGIIVGPLFFCVFSAMKIYYDYDRYDTTVDADAGYQDTVSEDVAAAADTPRFVRQ
jgi:predicted PurR-regulated permease PerM